MEVLNVIGAKSLALNLHDITMPRQSYYVSHRCEDEGPSRIVVTCWLIIFITFVICHY